MAEALQAKELWSIEARLALLQLAKSGKEFTADDLIQLVGLPAGSEAINGNNAVGALFRYHHRLGTIKHKGFTASSRPGNHGRHVRVWVGCSQLSGRD